MLLCCILSGFSHEEAARVCKISLSTVRRRVDDPAFRERLKNYGAELIKNTTGHLATITSESVDTLHKLLGGRMPASVRLGAARTIIELSLRLRETVELGEKLEEIQKRLKAQEKRR